MDCLVDKLPIQLKRAKFSIGESEFVVRPFQTIVYVALRPHPFLRVRFGESIFPAVLDSALHVSMLIHQDHFRDWAGIEYFAYYPNWRRKSVQWTKEVANRSAGKPLPEQIEWPEEPFNVVLFANEPGRIHLAKSRKQCEIPMDGVVVNTTQSKRPYPRLPIIGPKALALGRLRATIDGSGIPSLSVFAPPAAIEYPS